MKYLVLSCVFAAGFMAALAMQNALADGQPQKPTPPPFPDRLAPANPNIDFNGYLKIAREAYQHRAKRRVTEEDFIKMSQEEGVIILDARSKEKYDILHIKGAVNLSFPDMDIESLKKALPKKDAKILIYCNNNFTAGAAPSSVVITPNGIQGKAAAAFPSKNPTLSLNISTYTVLYGYGYKNVYELGPLLDPAKTKIPLVSNEKK
ncbi:MAG: rhodanese-like domain-containing protein [Planctomycetia bacterium]|nr:rhodanese-like domain-containing protein [Planctomycetia bacterium]